MTVPSSQYGNALAVGVETTYGTAVATTDAQFKVVDGSFRWSVDDALVPSAGGAATGVPFEFSYHATKPGAFEKIKLVQATFTIEPEADDFGFLMAALVGAPTYSVDTPVASAYTHEFDAIEAVPAAMPKPLSLGWNDNISDGRLISFTPTGIVFRSGDGNTPIQADITGVAQDIELGATFTPPGFSTAPCFERQYAAARIDAALATPNSSDDLTGDDAVEAWSFEVRCPKRVLGRSGSRLIREPVFLPGWYAGLSITKDWANTTYQDIMRNASPASRFRAASVFMNTAVNVTGSTKYSAEFLLTAGLLQGDPPEFSGPIGKETLMFVGAYDGTNPVWKYNMINGTTGATTYSS